MFLIRLSICIDFIITPVTPGLGHSNLHKKSITIGELSGQYYFGQKGQSYCSQRGQSCLAKRVKVAWLFQTVTKRQNLRSSVHIDFLFNSCTDVLRPIVSRVCDGSSQNQSHLLSVCHSERKASKGLSAA